MESKSETVTATNGAQVEIGTVSFQGREFSALGSVVDDQAGRVTGYVYGRELKSWDGKQVIGTLSVVSSKPAIFFGRRSWIGSTYYYFRARINGRSYHGSGFGEGMVLNLRACRSN